MATTYAIVAAAPGQQPSMLWQPEMGGWVPLQWQESSESAPCWQQPPAQQGVCWQPMQMPSPCAATPSEELTPGCAWTFPTSPCGMTGLLLAPTVLTAGTGEEASSATASASHTPRSSTGGPSDVQTEVCDMAGRCSASAQRRRRRRLAAQRAAAVAEPAMPMQQQQPGPPQYHAGSAAAAVDTSEVAASSRAASLTLALEAGGEKRIAALAALPGAVLSLSMDAAGCRVVQLALQVADRKSSADIVSELRGHVLDALASPHGNYVIQKVIELLPTSLSAFVAQELYGFGSAVARHRYGCRVICRLFEHCAGEAGTLEVAGEILREASELSRHCFGHHVLGSLLEHGLPEQRKMICTALRGDLLRSARNRNASYTIEKALTYGSEEDQQALVEELLGNPEHVASLATHQFGAYVVRALLRSPGDAANRARCSLERAALQVRATKHGQRVLDELELGPKAAMAA